MVDYWKHNEQIGKKLENEEWWKKHSDEEKNEFIRRLHNYYTTGFESWFYSGEKGYFLEDVLKEIQHNREYIGYLLSQNNEHFPRSRINVCNRIIKYSKKNEQEIDREHIRNVLDSIGTRGIFDFWGEMQLIQETMIEKDEFLKIFSDLVKPRQNKNSEWFVTWRTLEEFCRDTSQKLKDECFLDILEQSKGIIIDNPYNLNTLYNCPSEEVRKQNAEKVVSYLLSLKKEIILNEKIEKDKKEKLLETVDSHLGSIWAELSVTEQQENKHLFENIMNGLQESEDYYHMGLLYANSCSEIQQENKQRYQQILKSIIKQYNDKKDSEKKWSLGSRMMYILKRNKEKHPDYNEDENVIYEISKIYFTENEKRRYVLNDETNQFLGLCSDEFQKKIYSYFITDLKDKNGKNVLKDSINEALYYKGIKEKNRILSSIEMINSDVWKRRIECVRNGYVKEEDEPLLYGLKLKYSRTNFNESDNLLIAPSLIEDLKNNPNILSDYGGKFGNLYGERLNRILGFWPQIEPVVQYEENYGRSDVESIYANAIKAQNMKEYLCQNKDEIREIKMESEYIDIIKAFYDKKMELETERRKARNNIEKYSNISEKITSIILGEDIDLIAATRGINIPDEISLEEKRDLVLKSVFGDNENVEEKSNRLKKDITHGIVNQTVIQEVKSSLNIEDRAFVENFEYSKNWYISYSKDGIQSDFIRENSSQEEKVTFESKKGEKSQILSMEKLHNASIGTTLEEMGNMQEILASAEKTNEGDVQGDE